jgi:hypothetical protein
MIGRRWSRSKYVATHQLGERDVDMTIELQILGIRLFTLAITHDDEPDSEFANNTDGEFELSEELPFGFAPGGGYDEDFDDD